mgnify:CR=1 FL=1
MGRTVKLRPDWEQVKYDCSVKIAEKIVFSPEGVDGESLILCHRRDIGTVILPHADLKIFLTADSAQRSIRRLAVDKSQFGGDSFRRCCFARSRRAVNRNRSHHIFLLLPY